MDTNTGGKIAAGCGSLLLFAGFLVTLFGAFHVFLDPGGGISDREAMPALLGGVVCMLFSVVVTGIGGVLAFRKSQTLATGGPGQAAPVSGAFPWHLLSGCGSLFFVLTMCLSMGGAAYSYDEMQRWQQRRDDDVMSGEMPIIVMIDEGAIRRHERTMMMSGCCCFGSLFLLIAGAGGTAVLVRRRRAV